MKTTAQYMVIAAAALLFGCANDGALKAQTGSEAARKGRPALAAPIRVVGAHIRKVPSSFMRKLSKGEKSKPVEVLDLAVEVSSRALDGFAPSLEPLLHIGPKAYSVQRVEYSNWDLRHEKPIDKNAPVGETQTLHIFIEDWQKLKPDQPMILTIMSPEDIKKAVGGRFTAAQLRRIMPELTQEIPRYAPHDFMKLKKDN